MLISGELSLHPLLVCSTAIVGSVRYLQSTHTCPEFKIKDIKPLITMVGGNIVYEYNQAQD